jgi:hypothetical protein
MEVGSHSITRQEATAMRRSRQQSLREQVGLLRRQFLQDGALPFTDVLTEEVIAQALSAVAGWRSRQQSLREQVGLLRRQFLQDGAFRGRRCDYPGVAPDRYFGVSLNGGGTGKLRVKDWLGLPGRPSLGARFEKLPLLRG